MPVLTDQDRRGQHRHDHLDDEDDGRDLRGRSLLQGAHLGQQPDARGDAGGDRPQQRGLDVALMQGVGGELGRQAAPRERRPGAERCDGSATAQRERHERQDRDPAEDAGQRAGAGVLGRDVGRDEAQQGDAGQDRGDGGDFAEADAFVEVAYPDEQQQDEAEGECGLDDGQRREQQRDRLQRPAGEVEARSDQPAWTADQPCQQRRPQAFVGRRVARVERLQRQADVVERGGRAGSGDAEQERGHGSA
jgi:hypothetical protein